jgi:membrane protease subunit (stomatin/prohibitin family)
MGFFKNIIKGQLIDVIEWIDDSRDVMVHRYDMNGKDIMMGAQLTVRESQVAVFMNEGQIADVYNPGRHELTTSNMPIMTALKSWKFGFNSPFKADVFFVNTRQFLDLKWGTANPVMMRDSDFGVIRLRAYGIYSFRVKDPVLFLKEVFGTNSLFTVSGVEGQLKRVIVSSLSDAIAESKIPALDLAANYDELGGLAQKALQPTAQGIGLELTSFVVENISLPEEVEKTMDRRTSMGVLGDMGRYTQYQAAEAMREAANNPGGGSMAGMGVGMGAGAMMGQMFTQSMHQAAQPVPQQQVQPANNVCVRCGAAIAPNTKFCPECGASQAAPKCVGCGAMLPPGTKFCPECGAKQ